MLEIVKFNAFVSHFSPHTYFERALDLLTVQSQRARKKYSKFITKRTVWRLNYSFQRETSESRFHAHKNRRRKKLSISFR